MSPDRRRVARRVILAGYVVLLHVAVVVLVIELVSAGSGSIVDSDWHRRMRAFHARIDANLPAGTILFIGDSHVQGLCVSCVTDHGANLGIGRDTTDGVLTRLRELGSVSRAGAVVLEIGHNDLEVLSDEAIVRNYGSILATIPSGVPVIFNSQFPVDYAGEGASDEINGRKQGLNAQLERLCNSYHNCRNLPMYLYLTAPSGRLAPRYNLGDGTHLSRLGYAVWIERLRGALHALPE